MAKKLGGDYLDRVGGSLDLVRELKTAKTKTREEGQQVILHKLIRQVYPNYKFYKFHAELIKQLQRVIDGDCKRLIVQCPPRQGKEISHSTPVLTTRGWKTHGELVPGDEVFHPSGRPVKVVALSQEVRSNALVHIWKNRKIECHMNHEWTLFDRKCRKWRTVETRELVEWSASRTDRSRFLLPDINALQFERQELPMDPYVFGAWLGDGTTNANLICGAYQDRAIAEEFERRGYQVTKKYQQETTGVWYYRIDGTRTGGNGRFSKELAKTGARQDKYIPEIYLRSSIDQRLLLLAGLIDTDGSVCPKTGRTIVSTSSKRLADGVFDLCTSLGFRPYVCIDRPKLSTSGIHGRKSIYNIGFQPNLEIPCVLDRKKTILGAVRRRVGILSAQVILNGEMGRCIQVDSMDGLYLVGRDLTPTHNSLLSSKLLPAAYLLAHPERFVAICSYSAELAEGFSRDAREFYREAGGLLDPFSQSVNRWGTQGSGGCWATGIGGSVTGRSASLIIADDTVKGREEAESPRTMEKLFSFYQGSLYTRLEPGHGSIIVVATRWSDDDLTGRLLELERNAPVEARENWTIMDFPAISEDSGSRPPLPNHCEIVPDWRETGGLALCPQRYDVPDLERIRLAVGAREWSALYQQRPAPLSGNMFNPDWWQYYESVDELPEMDRIMLSVDCTFTSSSDSDYVVGTVIGQYGNRFYVLDMARSKTDLGGTIGMILRLIEKHPISGTIIELAANGFAVYQTLQSRIPGLIGYKPGDRSKIARLSGIVPVVEAGNVYLPAYVTWLDTFLNEFSLFPAAKNDDICDSVAQCINYLNQRTAPRMTEVYWGRGAVLPDNIQRLDLN
jgi:predicted phage terminase large subunit-like protein